MRGKGDDGDIGRVEDHPDGPCGSYPRDWVYDGRTGNGNYE